MINPMAMRSWATFALVIIVVELTGYLRDFSDLPRVNLQRRRASFVCFDSGG
jgi:hypothetical protein